MEEMAKRLCRKHRLQIQERFNSGNICSGVFKVKDRRDKILVLKIGVDETTIAEIKRNDIGYQRMKKHGLDWLIPEILTLKIGNKFAYMIMEYCGDGFFKQVQKVQNPIQLYIQLITELKKMYTQSKQKSPEGKRMIISVINKIKEQYEKYIFKYLDKERLLAKELDRIEPALDIKKIQFCCFSNWDFTPEDVYLTSNGLKYSDPHEDILGIPIVDMACFAGVARDAHNIPGSKEGYELLKEFAIKEIPKILDIPKETAYKIFYLGRLLQCLLSTRFRIKSQPERAQEIFSQGKKYLERII